METQQPPSPPGAPSTACPTGTCGASRWLLWLALILFAVVYFNSNRTQTVPAAFTWTEDLDQGLALASQKGQPVLVKFHATWCGPCQMMDRDVFSRQDVAKALAGWVPVSVDVDKSPAVKAKYGIESIPTLLVLDKAGQVLARWEGTMTAQGFIEFLQSNRPPDTRPG